MSNRVVEYKSLSGKDEEKVLTFKFVDDNDDKQKVDVSCLNKRYFDKDEHKDDVIGYVLLKNKKKYSGEEEGTLIGIEDYKVDIYEKKKIYHGIVGYVETTDGKYLAVVKSYLLIIILFKLLLIGFILGMLFGAFNKPAETVTPEPVVTETQPEKQETQETVTVPEETTIKEETKTEETDELSYWVNFLNKDGSVILRKQYKYGTTPSYPSDPTYYDGIANYAFTGWDKKLSVVKGAQTYTAQYKITGYIDSDKGKDSGDSGSSTKKEEKTVIKTDHAIESTGSSDDGLTYTASSPAQADTKLYNDTYSPSTPAIAEGGTTVVFESGALSTNDTNAIDLKVVATPLLDSVYDTVGAKNSDNSSDSGKALFTISSSGTTNNNRALGAIDLTVKVNGNTVTSFNDNKTVKVTTYVAKQISYFGMSYTDSEGTTNWTVKTSESEVSEAGDCYYKKDDGKLVFITDHFSTFVIEGEDCVYDEKNDTVYRLDELAEKVNNGTSFLGEILYLLKDDTYFDGKTSWIHDDSSNSTSTWETTIGSSSGKFAGTFNGKNKTIEYKITGGTGKHVALFGYTDGATIENLTVSGSNDCAAGGGVISYAYNTKVDNVTNYVNVTSSDKAGGIIETIASGNTIVNDETTKTPTISNCNNYGNIKYTGGQNKGCGGIVGSTNGLNDGYVYIYNCKNYGKIESNSYGVGTGGILGYKQNGKISTFKIEGCDNYGDVIADVNVKNSTAGGIAGWICFNGSIQSCTNYGNVTGYRAGGIAGEFNDVNNDSSTTGIFDCTNGQNKIYPIITGSYAASAILGEIGNTDVVEISISDIGNPTISGTGTYKGMIVGYVGVLDKLELKQTPGSSYNSLPTFGYIGGNGVGEKPAIQVDEGCHLYGLTFKDGEVTGENHNLGNMKWLRYIFAADSYCNDTKVESPVTYQEYSHDADGDLSSGYLIVGNDNKYYSYNGDLYTGIILGVKFEDGIVK